MLAAEWALVLRKLVAGGEASNAPSVSRGWRGAVERRLLVDQQEQRNQDKRALPPAGPPSPASSMLKTPGTCPQPGPTDEKATVTHPVLPQTLRVPRAPRQHRLELCPVPGTWAKVRQQKGPYCHILKSARGNQGISLSKSLGCPDSCGLGVVASCILNLLGLSLCVDE